MLSLLFVAMLAAGSDNSARTLFTGCLRSSYEKGTAQKLAADAYDAFAKQECAVQMQGFRSAVIGYDMKAGWTRKKAEPDADSQVNDYLGEWTDRYRDSHSATAAK